MKLTTRLRILPAGCVLSVQLSCICPALAQDTSKSAIAAQNPAPINALEVEGGYGFDFRSSNRSEGYYRINYKGALVRGAGTPFKASSGLDLAEPTLKKGAGDRNSLSLCLKHGTAGVEGGYFEANGVKPISLRMLEALDLRGAATLITDTDFRKVQLAAGLESRPWRIPGFSKTTFSNWVVFGVNALRIEDTDADGSDENTGLVTYRAFLGKALGWRKSADANEVAVELERRLLDEAPTLARAKELEPQIAGVPATDRTELQKLLWDAIGEASTDSDWVQIVHDISVGQADAITDQATFAFYAEASGWYDFGESAEGSRFRNLATVTIDYWVLEQTDDLFLRLRYEIGYERAIPTERINNLLVAISIRL